MLVCTGAVLSLRAQSSTSGDELQRQINDLKQQQKETQAELAELKEILDPILDKLPKPFKPHDVSVSGSPTMGEPTAKVTLIEFSDLQCPFCVRYYNNTYPRIVKNYVETGKVRYVAREFPLTTIHHQAKRASQAALCAGQQGKYWDLRKKIFANRDKLSDQDLESYASDVGVDIGPWKSCLETEAYDQKVRKDLRDGSAIGIHGTPAFALGLTDPHNPDRIRATRLIEGAYPYETFQQAIEALLKKDGD